MLKKILIAAILLLSANIQAQTLYGFVKSGDDLKKSGLEVKLYYSKSLSDRVEIPLDKNLGFTVSSNEIMNSDDIVVFNSYLIVSGKEIPYLSKVYFNEDLIEINFEQQAIEYFWGHTGLYYKYAKNVSEKRSVVKQLKVLTKDFAKHIEENTNNDVLYMSKTDHLRQNSSNFDKIYYDTLVEIERNLRKYLR